MHQNLAVILRQFIYFKNSFIVLIPGIREERQECEKKPRPAQMEVDLQQVFLKCAATADGRFYWNMSFGQNKYFGLIYSRHKLSLIKMPWTKSYKDFNVNFKQR